MKVKLLRNTVGGKKGDIIDVTDEQGNFFVRYGIAELVEKILKTEPEKKAVKKEVPTKQAKRTVKK